MQGSTYPPTIVVTATLDMRAHVPSRLRSIIGRYFRTKYSSFQNRQICISGRLCRGELSLNGCLFLYSQHLEMLPKVLERRRKFLFGVGGCAFLISFFVYLEPVKHNMLSAPPKLPFNSNSTSTAILATDELSTESPPNVSYISLHRGSCTNL